MAKSIKSFLFSVFFASLIKAEMVHIVRPLKDTFIYMEPVFLELIVINTGDDLDSVPYISWWHEGKLWNHRGDTFKPNVPDINKPAGGCTWIKLEPGDTYFYPTRDFALQWTYGRLTTTGKIYKDYVTLPPGKYFFKMKRRDFDCRIMDFRYFESQNVAIFWIIPPPPEKQNIINILEEAYKMRIKNPGVYFKKLLEALRLSRGDPMFEPWILHLVNAMYFVRGENRKVIETSREIIEKYPDSPLAATHIMALPGEYSNLGAYNSEEIIKYYEYITKRYPDTEASKAAKKMKEKIEAGWEPPRERYKKFWKKYERLKNREREK